MPNTLKSRFKLNNLTLCSDAKQASVYTAHQIAELIIQQQKLGKPAILGLATGNTPKCHQFQS